jgi:hypothetical protein
MKEIYLKHKIKQKKLLAYLDLKRNLYKKKRQATEAQKKMWLSIYKKQFG